MSDACDIFRDGCKTIMSILVILTNDCGLFIKKRKERERENSIENICLELHCDRLTSDDRFFSNLFRLLQTIEQSSLPNEDKFDALALVCLFYFFLFLYLISLFDLFRHLIY